MTQEAGARSSGASGGSPRPAGPRAGGALDDPIGKARLLVEAALDRKAERVIALDVRELCSFADVFVVASGSSDRHVRSIVDGIERTLREAGERALGIEGREEGRWVLMDFTDVIVHVFQREARAHYDVERLWGDAPELAFPGLQQASSTT